MGWIQQLKNGGRQACNDVFGPPCASLRQSRSRPAKNLDAFERFITNAIYPAEAELVAGTDRTAAGKIDLQQLHRAFFIRSNCDLNFSQGSSSSTRGVNQT